MAVKRAPKKATSVNEVSVEEVTEPETIVESNSDEILFIVKLDSKKFEARTLEQALDLIKGSVGVVSKVTIERQ